MRFFRRPPPATFDLALIGDRWESSPVALPAGESISLRTLPDGFARAAYPFVALVQPLMVVLPDQFGPWTASAHFALERDGQALLALVHRAPRQITWYAHAASRAQLDAALRTLEKTNPVRWAINEDAGWADYEHARNPAPPAPASPPADPAPVQPATDRAAARPPAIATVAAPPAPATLRCSPIDTPLGFLAGRNRIHLDAIEHDAAAGTLVLTGEISGDSEWIAYEARFGSVAAIASEDVERSAWTAISDFHDVQDSPWPAASAPEGPPRRHVILQTYRDLFHVACGDVTLQLGARRPLEAEPPERDSE